ncbi:MAG: GMC family oxidoreductase N-terminal domain-containing protein [Hyphomicrobiaceae bacterium]
MTESNTYDEDFFHEEYDVIVAGAGSAGCVVASRLTEDPSVSLCLIEAGKRDRNPWIHVPLGFGKVVPNPRLNWGYLTEPEPGLNNRQITWPRGKVLGGSGSINGLVFLRGAPSDFDEWERLGAKGWSYADVLPYFKRSEHNVDGVDAWRGEGGPMTISSIKDPSLPARAFVETAQHLQIPRNHDFNGEKIEGVGFVQLNVRNGRRVSTAVGYLKPNLARQNLRLMTETHVCRILLDGKRAVGLEVEQFGRIKRIRARRQVIVSGGSINSPVLLLASGIGPAAELKAMGIDVQHDLPGVGKDLQDHLMVRMVFKSKAKGTLNEIMQSPIKQAAMAWQYLTQRSGQLAVGATEATMFVKSRPSEAVPDLQFQCVNFSTEGAFKVGLHAFPGFMFNFCICRPYSRGEITLRDREGRDPPRIQPNYMTHDEDWRMMLDGWKLAQQIRDTAPFKDLIESQHLPGPEVQSPEDFKEYVRNNASTVYHPCATCRMGVDDRAVTTPELAVRGIEGLSVIDASVMPMVPSSNIHPATIMVAEKGAEHVRARLRAQ